MAFGTISTVLSVFGVLDKFTDFLILLGVLFPPIGGVMLVDYYILRTSRVLLDTTRGEGSLPGAASTSLIGWSAIMAWFAGSLVGLTIEWGIPSLNSFLIAAVFYGIIGRVARGDPRATRPITAS